MLTRKSDYLYVDWTRPELADAKIDGTIMPIEEARYKPSALRYEDFCYLFESIYDMHYFGSYMNTKFLPPMPSVEGQYTLKSRIMNMSGYMTTNSLVAFDTMCLRDGTVSATQWFTLPTNGNDRIFDGLKQVIPESALIDFSALPTNNLDPDVIDDSYMKALYSFMGQPMIYHVAGTTVSNTWSQYDIHNTIVEFSGHAVYKRFNPDGTQDSSRSAEGDFSMSPSSFIHDTAGMNLELKYPWNNNTGRTLCSRSFSSDYPYYGAKSNEMYLSSSRLVVGVPPGTTDCWMYLNTTPYSGGTNQVESGRIFAAQVNSSANTATVTGFAGLDDLESHCSVQTATRGSYDFGIRLSAVLCKVNQRWAWNDDVARIRQNQ